MANIYSYTIWAFSSEKIRRFFKLYNRYYKGGTKIMKKLSKRVLMLVATFTTLLASIVASSACVWCVYQPEEPKCLKEE